MAKHLITCAAEAPDTFRGKCTRKAKNAVTFHGCLTFFFCDKHDTETVHKIFYDRYYHTARRMFPHRFQKKTEAATP